MLLSAVESSRKLLRFGNPFGQKLSYIGQQALQHGVV